MFFKSFSLIMIKPDSDLLRLDRGSEREIDNLQDRFYRRFHVDGINVRRADSAGGPMLVCCFEEATPV